MKSCFMFGHRDCPDNMLPQIEKAIESYYTKYNVKDFYIGSRGRFDSLAATAVKRAKAVHTDIRLFLVLSYHPAERPADLWGGFDGAYYPPLEGVPRPYAIVKSNQYMLDTSAFLFAMCGISATQKTFWSMYGEEKPRM